MDLAEKYAYKVSELRSFSAAAKALFVSQPALSATVSRLEDSLGFKIFDRKTKPLALTPEGRIYVEFLEESIEREVEMERRVRNISDAEYGSISVGGSCYTAYRVLPEVCGEFYKNHPEIRVDIDMGNEATYGNLKEKLRRGAIDLMIGYSFDPIDFFGEVLFEERLAVAMHKSLVTSDIMPYAITRAEFFERKYGDEKLFSDPEPFINIRFIGHGPHTDTAERAHDILGETKHSYYSIKNSHHTAMHYNLMRKGIGAVLVADSHASAGLTGSDDVLYFVPRNPASRRPLYLISRHGAELSPAACAFRKTALDVCRRLYSPGDAFDA